MQNTSMTYGAGGAARAAAGAPWGQRRGWRYGSPEFAVKSLLVYLLVAFAPLVAFVFDGFRAPAWPIDYPPLAVGWAAFVALAFPFWTWGETRAFERWTASLDAAQRDAAQARQTLRAAGARLFWFGTLAVVGLVGLLGFMTR